MPATALTAVRDTKAKEGRVVRYLMAASKVIYKGAMVGLASGLAQPFGDGSGELFAGVAEESVTSASSGSYYVRVRKTGVHAMAWYDDNAVAQADVGVEVYGASDAQVTPTASGGGTTAKAANNIKVGKLAGFEGTVPMVRIDGYA